MTEDESAALAALVRLLDLTDEDDWWMVHATVRDDIKAGKYGRQFELAYRELVDKKLAERGAL